MTHGLWNLRVKIDGETITEAEPVVGYLHRGWEKITEHRMFPQIIPMADRLCYGASMSWSHLYCLTAERLLDVEVPERAKYIRTIVLEAQRIGSHLMWLAALGTDLGSYTGARMTYNYPRIGGVRNDAPPNFERDFTRVMNCFEKRLKDIEALCDQSTIFRMRMEGIGYISGEQAKNLGVTGPNLRGSGVDYDVRRDDPYEIYDQLEWSTCVQKGCDSFARYRVRIDEMYESMNIIRQALKKMPDGPVRVKPPRNAPRGKTAWARVEDPRGEGLMYIIGNGDDHPYRLKVRSPIFVTVSAAPVMLLGNKVADVPAIMGSVDMCLGETDR
jgi:NADH-quinone oxidoreductase subunit D